MRHSPVRFFYAHAGYSYDAKHETAQQGRWRCARELASAEAWAAQQGLVFSWEPDEDADWSWMSDEERAESHEVFVCLCRNRAGEILARRYHGHNLTYEEARAMCEQWNATHNPGPLSRKMEFEHDQANRPPHHP